MGRSKIGDRRRHHHGVGVRDRSLERGQHFQGALDIDPPGDAGGRGQGDRTGDEGDLGAESRRCSGQGEAHLPRGSIAQKTYVVDRFEGGTCRHHHLPAGESAPGGAPGQDRLRFGDHLGRVDQAARSDPAAGQLAPVRADGAHAAGAEQATQVVLREGVFPHVHVHGRRKQDGGP